MTGPDQNARIDAFVRELDGRCATRTEGFALGTAYLNLDYPRRYDANFLVVEASSDRVDAGALAADAERILGEHALEHRKVVVRDEPLGRRLAPGFAELGWSAERLVTMTRVRDAEPRRRAAVRRVGFDEARPIHEEMLRREPYGNDAETVRQLAEFRRVLEREADAGFFVADVAGRPASVCELYVIDRVAQIEDVATLEEYRGRGLASAVVLAAADEARERGCDVAFLVADDEDWPKHLYRRLGFEATSRSWSFLRVPVDGPAQRT